MKPKCGVPAACYMKRMLSASLCRSWSFGFGGWFAVFLALGLIGTPAVGRAGSIPFEFRVPSLRRMPAMTGVINASWNEATQIPVAFDFTYLRAGERATAFVGQDPTGLDVAFVVIQRQPIIAQQRTNGSGVLEDDSVTVDLYPEGANGFAYSFTSNSNGARFQTSTENSAYSPDWIAAARRTASGYVVTMHIPFSIIRAGGSTMWRAQFERQIVATNSTDVWEHQVGQTNAADPAFAGTLVGVQDVAAKRARWPKARVQTYAIGEATTKQFGGNTSRVGMDIALPVTRTSSLVATLHPDYSDVETDQQTIAPNAFERQYTEVRPFFTQVGSNFNQMFTCNNCPITLYTPAIPTFSKGYAYEGTQGPFSFAAFDALGANRDDNAQTLTYTLQDSSRVAAASYQRVDVNLPGISDDSSMVSTGYFNKRTHVYGYFNGGEDRGTEVTDPGFGDYFEYGVGYGSKNTTVGLDFQKIGPQFEPIDGYVSLPGVAGYNLGGSHTIEFSPKATLEDVMFSGYDVIAHSPSGQRAEIEQGGDVEFDLSKLYSLQLFGGFSGYATVSGEFLPFNRNGFVASYKGKTTTPSSIEYSGGMYYHGHLTSWSYITTIPLTSHVALGLEADENLYTPLRSSGEPVAQQWLQRANLNWQLSRDASLDIGVRRIIGRNLPNAFQVPQLPTSSDPLGVVNGFEPFDFVDEGSVNAAFHVLAGHNEFYLAYGNPNYPFTLPAVFVKWIHYFGAEKGT